MPSSRSRTTWPRSASSSRSPSSNGEPWSRPRNRFGLFTNRYRGGVDNYLQVITAQTVTLTNQRTEIDILRRRMDASVLLVKALGGGWDVAALTKSKE